jgi:glucose/arabinose dehydrogenase
MSTSDNWWVFPGFEIEEVATDLDLPVNIAFVPNASSDPKTPVLYVTELYGQVKAITNDGSKYTYAHDLLNYEPDYKIPGSGESGVIGICVEPETRDLFISMVYVDNNQVKGKVIRPSSKNGLHMDHTETIIDNIPSTTKAHQIQAVSIGFDEKLYVNVGDGGEYEQAQNDKDLRGKILRMNLDGTIPDDNPSPGSYIFAKGLRNPFGATWRRSNKSLYVSINGPDRDDVFAKVKAGGNHGWPLTMRKNATFIWEYTQAPTALDFMQDGQFPEEFHDELFIALFGNSYLKGRSIKGKKIVKVKLNPEGSGVIAYDEFVAYIGSGPASPCGLAFGPSGLYFTDLHGEGDGATEQPKGSIYRVKPKNKLASASLEGVMLAKSETYEMVESNVYFPPNAINWEHLKESSDNFISPLLGEATYYDITLGDLREPNAAWTFHNPSKGFEHIKDYLAFGYGQVDLLTERTG